MKLNLCLTKNQAEGKIKVFKHFRFIEVYEGIYRDLYEGEKFYFKIPIQLNWKIFDHLTKRVKARMSDSNFDTAIGIINRFMGPEDIVRVYDKNKTLERALEIRKHFLKEIRKERMLISNYLDSSFI
ncbi:MAG: hypothetical protein HC906_01375 [Bacteroidales bacterium]|nr:hypothetical protein [Bacteroidales bacterium]